MRSNPRQSPASPRWNCGGWAYPPASRCALRPAAAGGHFDYHPRLRNEHDENYPGVQKVLHGNGDGVLRLPSSPGTLAVFRGQHALHRVTPVIGSRPRINSVLTYGEHPGMKLTELTQKLFYGRTA